MNAELRAKVEEIIGPIKEFNVLVEQGCTSEVGQLVTEKQTYLLKSSFKEKYREWLRAEAAVLNRLRKSNHIPVPKYYGFIDEKDSSHVIMSFENGITLTSALKKTDDVTEKQRLLRSFGKLVNKLHETEPPEFFKGQEDWLEKQLKKAEYYAKKGQADGSMELLEKIKEERPQPIKQTMIHGDCTTDNVLVVEGEVRLFIDVSGMTVGDPRYDIALAIGDFVDDDELKDAFYEGYTRYKVSKEEYLFFEQGLYEFF